jgi:protein-S-isoprenylcysteine O-methyltransferase Ste14
MITPGSLISALWLVWLVGWLIAARSTAKTVARQPVASRFAHSALIWAGAAMLFFLRPDRFDLLQHPVLPNSPWIGWGGAVLVAIGLGFTAWARVHLGRFWSGAVTLKAEHALIRTGPYAMTRHPIYTGLLLALLGTAMAQDTLAALVGATLLTLGLILKISQEERLLTEHFGDAYRAYRAEVPSLIPRLRGGSGVGTGRQ